MNYKEFDGWKLVAELSKWVYYFTRRLPSTEEFGLLHQLIPAAVSTPLSVAEGVGLKSSKETTPFFFIARGSFFGFETQRILCKEIKIQSANKQL